MVRGAVYPELGEGELNPFMVSLPNHKGCPTGMDAIISQDAESLQDTRHTVRGSVSLIPPTNRAHRS